MFGCTHCPALWFLSLFPNCPKPINRFWNQSIRSWAVVYLLRGRVEWEIAEPTGMRLTCVSGLCAHILVYRVKCVVWALGCRPRCFENTALTPLAFAFLEHPGLCMLLLPERFLFAYLCMATCFSTCKFELKYCLLRRVFPTFLQKQGMQSVSTWPSKSP